MESELRSDHETGEDVRAPDGVLVFTGSPSSGKDDLGQLLRVGQMQGWDPARTIICPSISTVEAFADADFEKDVYKERAEQMAAILGSGAKELLILTHSLGSAEALMFLRAIQVDDRYKDKKIRIVMHSPILFGTEKLGALKKIFRGTFDILFRRDLREANYLIPPPENVRNMMEHRLTDGVANSDIVTMSLSREAEQYRQDIFETVARKQLGPIGYGELRMKLRVIDEQLVKHPADKDLLDLRARIIAPFVGGVMTGEYLNSDEAEEALGRFGEKSKGLRTNLSLAAHLFFNRFRPGFGLVRDLWLGHGSVLETLRKQLEIQNTQLDITFVLGENDLFLDQEQARAIQNIGNSTKLFLKDSTHYTASYDAQTVSQTLH